MFSKIRDRFGGRLKEANTGSAAMNSKKTAEVTVSDPKLGIGFRTGDRGRLDEDGYLFITGRFKEEYKLENGKYVHPASLEEDIKLNAYV